MEDENLTSQEAVPGLEPEGTEETVSEDSVESLTLSELNSFLGKNFKDKDSALKSLKDTQNFVGKKKEPKVDENNFVSREQYELDMFYSRNPEYNTDIVKDYLTSKHKAEGGDIEAIAKSDEFKKFFNTVQGYNESQNKKSVLESNPTLGRATDRMQKARETANKVRVGELPAGAQAEAEYEATNAVLEAFDM